MDPDARLTLVSLASLSYDSNSGGTREIQRTMLELLNQLDGFDERGDVKVRSPGRDLHCVPVLTDPTTASSTHPHAPVTDVTQHFMPFCSTQVIMATNKIESLDPALIRPGRIDRKIEFPLPDIKTKRRIFGIHTSRMTLAEDVDLEVFIMAKDELSGADIKVRRCSSTLSLGVSLRTCESNMLPNMPVPAYIGRVHGGRPAGAA